MKLKQFNLNTTTGSILFVGLVLAAAVLPVFLVAIPAMNDYPGHLARMYILNSIGTAEQNPYYYYYLPYIYPNLAMDIIVPIFARFIDVAQATKAFLILAQILLVSGAIALEFAVKRRHEFAGFVGVAALYSLPFAWGFLNFEFGVGLGLWGLASWFALESKDRFTRLVVHTIVCVLLFVCHLVAFGLYGATLGFYEMWHAFQSGTNWKARIKTIAILAAPAAIIFAYYATSTANIVTGTSEPGEAMFEWSSYTKFLSIFHGMNGYNTFLSVGDIFAILAVTFYLLKKRHLSILPQGKWIAGGFLILILFLPFRLFAGDFLNLRIAIGGLLILPAFLIFSQTNTSLRFVPPLLLSLVGIVNAGQIARFWFTYEPDYAALLTSFKQIRFNSFVLVGYNNFENDRFDKAKMPIMTATALVAHYSNAFIPTLFAIPGQQPLQVCPELKRFALTNTADYWPVAFSTLAAVAAGTITPKTPIHVRNWLLDYDYLYLLGPKGPNPMPGRLAVLSADKEFTLFRIKPPQARDEWFGTDRPRDSFAANSPCENHSQFRKLADFQGKLKN